MFDKTGTLTEGVFEVQKVQNIDITKEELIRLAAHAENYSNHPIAKSIKKDYGKNIDDTKISDIKEISGQGIICRVEDKEVMIGNEKLMQENNLKLEKNKEIGTTVHIAVDKRYAGYILISDKIKKDADSAIKGLKENGIKNIVMLTGDKKSVGEDVANKLGINTIYTELLPDEKVDKVEELLKQKSNKGKLIFVGDRNK